MRTAKHVAVIDVKRCTACDICVRICPVQAIRLEKVAEKRWLAVVDEQRCLDCTLCFTRCPKYAITMMERERPLTVGVDVAAVDEDAVTAICERAHMYPDQVVCYCHRVQAKEIAAAVIKGAKTPEEVALATGARTGCGTLCISGVIRLLRASGIELGKAPGYQWYGIKASIWDVSPELQSKYPLYYLADDVRAINEVFPTGKGEI